MDIYKCQRMAEKEGYDKATFDLCGPDGRIECKWLDAYMGIFSIKGDSSHFMMVGNFSGDEVWCQNFNGG